MSSKRFEGKNLEEAIDSAAKAFGVESFRVSYHVVLEKRGFLGGTKRVVIEAEVSGAADRKQSSERPARQEQSSKPARPAKSDRPEKAERPAKGERAEAGPEKRDRPKKDNRPPRRDRADRPKPARAKEEPREAPQFVYDDEPVAPKQPTSEGGDTERKESRDAAPDRNPRSSRRRGRRGRGGRGRGRGESSEGQSSTERSETPREKTVATSAPLAPVEIPEQGEQSDEAARIVTWCEAIFSASGLELVARTTEREEEISVELFGRDVEMITESSDYLDSLQVLANKAFTGRTIERPIEFDAGGFKRRREEDLAQRARETAERVREEGRERTMRAMSPIERRIVHLALEDDRSVTTESRGRGFHKRVVIQPAGEERAVAEES